MNNQTAKTNNITIRGIGSLPSPCYIEQIRASADHEANHIHTKNFAEVFLRASPFLRFMIDEPCSLINISRVDALINSDDQVDRDACGVVIYRDYRANYLTREKQAEHLADALAINEKIVLHVLDRMIEKYRLIEPDCYKVAKIHGLI